MYFLKDLFGKKSPTRQLSKKNQKKFLKINNCCIIGHDFQFKGEKNTRRYGSHYKIKRVMK